MSSDSKNRKNDLNESVEAMEKYIVRHVKKMDASFRSNAFMKLLTHVFEQDCSKKRMATLADKLMSET